MPEPTRQVAFRFPAELVARIDAFAARIADQNPGLEITRADAVRVLLEKALRSEGLEPAQSEKRKR